MTPPNRALDAKMSQREALIRIARFDLDQRPPPILCLLYRQATALMPSNPNFQN
jgi:hypothetical protein